MPDALSGWLAAYCALGDHRTGTAADRATIGWFADELAALGGTVAVQPFTFERFDGTADVTIDGRDVPAEPLAYEGVGTVSTSSPLVGVTAALGGDRPSAELGALIDAALAAGAPAAVIATEHPLGELQLPNRFPRIGSGLPVALVAGREAEALSGGRVAVSLRGRIVPGESANVVAAFGDGPRPVVLATPLSGWFTCAAERGTGIAVLLGLVAGLIDLAPGRPLVVVGTSGHELLPHVGVAAVLPTLDLDPALIVHLGANVAIAAPDPSTGEMALAPGRAVFARLDPSRVTPVTDALAPTGLAPVVDPPRWLGEGAPWADAHAAAPLLSFVGASPVFHTPADVPESTTCAAALAAVTTAIGDAIGAVTA